MKRLIAVGAVMLLGGSPAGAQIPSPPIGARGDVAVSIGWLNLRHPQNAPSGYRNDWLNTITYVSAASGWYVTDHVKTELEVFTTSRGHQFRTDQVRLNGGWTTSASEFQVRDTGTAAAIQYQFLHNTWVQPYVAGGIEVAHDATSDTDQPIYATDPVTHVFGEVAPARVESAGHWSARPFIGGGGKAYATRRTFVFGDMRLAFRGRIDRVLLRGGVGVEF